MPHRRGIAVLVFAGASSIAAAQAPDTVRRVTPAPLFTARDAAIAAGFAGLTVALLPFDRSVAVEIREPGAQSSQPLRNAASGFRALGSSGAVAAVGSMYVVGRLGHLPRLADLGLHGFEAIAIGAATTNLVKGLVGRARPYSVSDTNPRDVQFTRGFRRGGDYASFPSGHTTVAFALASSVTAETHRWWPRSSAFVAPLAFGAATLVGVSRLYSDDHWASDVSLAAGIGTLAGLKVVRYNHMHVGNRLDRLLLGASVVPVGSKALAVTWSSGR